MSPSNYSRMKQVSCMDIIDGNRFENCSPDDILVVAATPLCTIDLSDTPEADKDALYKGVYKFVSTVRNVSKQLINNDIGIEAIKLQNYFVEWKIIRTFASKIIKSVYLWQKNTILQTKKFFVRTSQLLRMHQQALNIVL